MTTIRFKGGDIDVRCVQGGNEVDADITEFDDDTDVLGILDDDAIETYAKDQLGLVEPTDE